MSLLSDIQRFNVKAKKRMEAAPRKVGFELWKRITMRMPVDTGRAKANTHLGMVSKPTHVDDTAKDDTPVKSIGQGNINRAMSLINTYSLGDTIWIANNVKYIGKLEFEFTSKQAPQGMFRISIADILTAWPNLVTEVKRENP